MRTALTLGLCALLAAGAFAFLHTGARADGVCEQERFVPADGMSLWPPGARCSYGEPQTTEVFLSWWFVPAVVVLLAGTAMIGRPARRGAA